MIKKVEAATFHILTAIQNNAFKGDSTITFNLEQDGVGFTATNAVLSQHIVTQLDGIRKDIINKRIKVIPTYREALSAGLVPPGLGAQDN
jgi:basic membrane lipoprotein Med (substrate-binding protein (PBP1-ABC) superfamily)